jgi:hypothetical protein
MGGGSAAACNRYFYRTAPSRKTPLRASNDPKASAGRPGFQWRQLAGALKLIAQRVEDNRAHPGYFNGTAAEVGIEAPRAQTSAGANA